MKAFRIFLLILGIDAIASGCMGFGQVDPEEIIYISYESDVKPLIDAKCGACHGDPPVGGSVTLIDEQSTKENAARIHARAVIMGDMPPGSPLSIAEKSILDTWIRATLASDAQDESRESADAGQDIDLSDETPSWDTQIGPLFAQTCVACHGSESPQSDLDLTSYEGLRRGGIQGPLLDDTNPETSLLVDYLRARNNKLQMPPSGALPTPELELIETWLVSGAPEASP